eukprot:1660411-Rhodomonas_salina.5
MLQRTALAEPTREVSASHIANLVRHEVQPRQAMAPAEHLTEHRCDVEVEATEVPTQVEPLYMKTGPCVHISFRWLDLVPDGVQDNPDLVGVEVELCKRW